MSFNSYDQLYKALVKAIAFAAGMVILLWLLYKAAGIILLLLFALILAIVINAPVARLEQKGMKRFWACLIVFGAILVVFSLLIWLIVPKISAQVTTLINNLPLYADQLSKNVSTWFEEYPEINKEIQSQGINLSQWVPSIPQTIMRIGNYSLSIVSIILIGILFISMVVYAVTNPGPLLHLYFSFFAPAHHPKAERALINTSTMLIGWIRSNIIGGGIRAVCTTIFLSIMNVPGAFVWGALALFAELIPRLGFFIMAIPPILVALSISPTTAFWVTAYMLVLDEIMGDFVLPKIRSNTMNIHPVSILFILLAMATVFGMMGALLATPLTAIIKAYYDEFYADRFQKDEQLESRVKAILYRRKTAAEPKEQ